MHILLHVKEEPKKKKHFNENEAHSSIRWQLTFPTSNNQRYIKANGGANGGAKRGLYLLANYDQLSI